jgi:hypothetical protein
MSKSIYDSLLTPDKAIIIQIDNICHDVPLSVVKSYYNALVEKDDDKMENILKSDRYTAAYNIERHLRNLVLTYGKSRIDNYLK